VTKKQRKRGSTGRRSSLPVDLNSGTRNEPYSSPTVVHSTRQQLQSAAPIISAIKGWSQQEYNLFIEGLLSFPDEKDINKKCKLISERFLPKYSPEDVKQCYAILHNYVKNKEEDQSDNAKRLKAVEGISGLSVPTYTTTSMTNTGEVPPVTLRYNLPRAGYPYNPYPGIPLSMYANMGEQYPSYASPYNSPDAALMAAQRRASFPMDAFSVTKAIPANEYNNNTTVTGTAPESEHLFNAAEYPSWGNNPHEPTNTSVESTHHVNHENQTNI